MSNDIICQPADPVLLETALHLAVGELSTYGSHINEEPQKLMNTILERAILLLQDSN
jgi:hypothetical protein